MLGAVGAALVVVAIGWFEIRQLAAASGSSRGKRRNIAIFLTLLALQAGLLIAHFAHARLPNPLAWIDAAVKLAGLQLKLK